MDDSHRKRLVEIDQQLQHAEQALDRFGETSSQGQAIKRDIARLQRERSALPPELLLEDKIAQKRAELAKNAGLMRLMQQRGEVSIRLTLMQKTVDQLREVLIALGASEADIAAAIREGEEDALRQNVQTLLGQISAAVKQMVLRCYEQRQPFPADIAVEVERWKNADSATLSKEQGAVLMRLHQAAAQNIPADDLRAALVAGAVLNADGKAALLHAVTEAARTLAHHRRLARQEPVDWVNMLRQWIAREVTPERGRETALFQPCLELLAYGVPRAEIDAAVRAGM